MTTAKKKPVSKKKATKKKPTNRKSGNNKVVPGKPRPSKIHAESELSNGWRLAGTIKRTDMKSAKDPVDKLHKKLKEFLPSGTSITQFGMGTAALKYFREQLKIAIKKEYSFLSTKKLETTLAWNMLQFSPCDIEGVEGFEVYVRAEDWRG